jgi:hypothetical protein
MKTTSSTYNWITMKKNICLSIALLLLAQTWLSAQVAINTDATTPNASAMLDIKSNSRGLLVPRLTTAQRTAIASPADGLWAYDTDTKSFWFFKGGIGWQEMSNGGGGLTLPFTGTAASNGPLFTITNTSTGGAILARAGTGGNGVWTSTGYLGGSGVLADNTVGGEAVTGRTTSTITTPAGAVVGRNDGPGYGVYGFVATDASGAGIGVLGRAGINNGKGAAGHFENINGSSNSTALESVTNGIGSGLTVINTNPSNVANIVHVATTGPGVIADHSVGNAGNFFMNNTNGVGAGVRGEVNSIFGNNGTAGVYGVASGSGGYGGYFEHSSTTGFGNALAVINAGLGTTAQFNVNNGANNQPVLNVATSGTGSAAVFSNPNSATTANVVNVTGIGPGVIADHSTGNAGNFFMNNTSGVGAGVRGEVNSIFGNNGTAGVYGVASGSGGYGGYFEHSSTTGFGRAMQVVNAGLGVGAAFSNSNAANTQAVVRIDNTTTAIANALEVVSSGPGSIGNHSTGNAANFFANNTSGVGAGVRGEVNSIFGNNGTAGVYGIASGTGGYGGYFEHSSSTGFGIALFVINAGQGNAMVVNQNGTSGDPAVFRLNGVNVARISRAGTGFFNGGTVNSGADLAEAFDVSGQKAEYEPGDVLAIATDADRRVQKSQQAYSSLVVGVYATKPGVLLNEENVDADLSDKVPMGVVGVIPTKVCNENGPIRRGDILVSASKPGYAMKADVNVLKPGQAIGKALQEFDGETGKIKVLVNVR